MSVKTKVLLGLIRQIWQNLWCWATLTLVTLAEQKENSLDCVIYAVNWWLDIYSLAMIFLSLQAPGVGFPMGTGEGDGTEAVLIAVVGVWGGFSLAAGFGLPLPSFTPSNIWCSFTNPQQSTAVIVYSSAPCISAPSALLCVTSRVGVPCSWGGNLALDVCSWLCWDKRRSQQRLQSLGSPGWTVPAVAASPLPGEMNISIAEARFAGWKRRWAALGGSPGAETGWWWWWGWGDATSTHRCIRACPARGLPSPAVEITGSSASPAAADGGSRDRIKGSNIMLWLTFFLKGLSPGSSKCLTDKIWSLVSSVCWC